MKTYLMEFYDKDYLENLISLFHRDYDGVYFSTLKILILEKDSI